MTNQFIIRECWFRCTDAVVAAAAAAAAADDDDNYEGDSNAIDNDTIDRSHINEILIAVMISIIWESNEFRVFLIKASNLLITIH